ncbi:hypothetical protein BC941DRAFT_511341 [Chlamydoabsidia padenii]|nr:hypothetical protein BC941DRAFT_511341 [Chlamydoabsidia padenii]
MSNPIADNANFFKRQSLHHSVIPSHRHSEGGLPRPDATGIDTTWRHEGRSNSLDHQTPTNKNGDNSRPWNRVLARLSQFGNNDHQGSTLGDNDSSNMTGGRYSTGDDGDTFELMRENRWFPIHFGGVRSGRYSNDTPQGDDDDVLPSTCDFKHGTAEDEQNRTNYFVHPFQPGEATTAIPSIVTCQPPAEESTNDSLPISFSGPIQFSRPDLQHEEGGSSSSTSSSDNTARPEETLESTKKTHWEKTLEKIKLISSMQQQDTPTTQLDTSATTIVATSNTLVPYYPPAFDPLFIAFTRDEHGHKSPPILLQCLNVSVTDSEFLDGMGQWAFRIELQYGDVKWVIYRTIAEFVMLHYLLKFKSSLSDYVPAPPTFPNQLQSLYDSAKTTIGWDRKEETDNQDGPTDQQQQQQDENEKQRDALDRRIALTTYLRELFQRAHMQISYDVCEFLELSAISMVQDMGWKGKEGYLEHQINFVNPRCCQFWTSHKWNTEWVLLRDSYMAFCETIASDYPTDVLMLDKGFTMTASEPSLLGGYHLTLTNQTRRIRLKGSKREMDEWWTNIRKVQSESPWVHNHRFGSFAPVRHNAKVKWFVDAENHFNAVAEAILSAKSEIYIADWWLSPELYLRRPPSENEDFRLDRLLQRKAREGVMIYIVVYKEMSLALTIDSAHTKQWLQKLHPNIIVQRHPDHASIDNNVLFWSHHEKIVVIDNRLAFIGGLDLCFGRYDSHQHSLSDCYSNQHEHEIFPGQDYSNPRKKDFVNVAQYDLTLVDRTEVPRMPWHDVTLATVGPMARDIARHFIQRWNYLKATKSMHRQNLPFLLPKGEYVAARDESKFKGTCRVQALRSSAQWSSGVEREHSIYNAYMECISQAKHFVYIENQFFISATDQDKLLRNKIAQALVERIIRAHEEQEKFKVFIIIPLVPAFEGDLSSSESGSARSVMHFQYMSISRGGNSIIERLTRAGINPSDYIDWYSLRNWGRISPTKQQHHQQKDQSTDDKPVHGDGNNQEEQTSSGVKLTDDADNDNETDTQDLADGDDEEYNDPDQYVTELLYIHDKIMIVDDRIVIIGSANINDRSQLGNRDSEIAMIIEDTDMVDAYMDGKKYKAAKFAHTLRLQLWKEHLGLLDFDDWSSLLNNEPTHEENDVDVESLQVSSATNQQEYDGDYNKDENENQQQPTQPHHHRHHGNRHRNKKHHRHSRVKRNNAQDIQACEAEEPVQMIDRLSRTKSLYDTYRNSTPATTHEDEPLEAKALDPLSDTCYYQLWRKTAHDNTLIYRRLFRCVPDDTVSTYQQHRVFTGMTSNEQAPSSTLFTTAHGHVADPLLSGQEIRQELEQIRGHLVQFPVNYLKDENMIGSNNLIDSVTPMVIFT